MNLVVVPHELVQAVNYSTAQDRATESICPTTTRVWSPETHSAALQLILVLGNGRST